mgnify:CR=1 FL=1
MEFDEFVKNGGFKRKPSNRTEEPQQNTLDEYIALRKKCDSMECQAFEFTKEDFEKFTKNFYEAFDYMDERFEDEESEFERIHNLMEQTNWTWRGKTPTIDELKDCVKDLFKCCMGSKYLKTSCSTGGFTVKTDIVDHYVFISFDTSQVDVWDSDNE